MAFITAIDKAVNPSRYREERATENQHELDMNAQLIEMIDGSEEQGAEYLRMMNDANAESLEAEKNFYATLSGGGAPPNPNDTQFDLSAWLPPNPNDHSFELSAGPSQGSTMPPNPNDDKFDISAWFSQNQTSYQPSSTGTDTSKSTGAGTTTTPPPMTMDDILAMFNVPSGGINFSADGSTNYTNGAGGMPTFSGGAGINFDANGQADYSFGNANPIQNSTADPFAFFDQLDTSTRPQGDVRSQFQNSGIQSDWMSNSYQVMNLNDLIAFFDNALASSNRPAGSQTSGTGGGAGGSTGTGDSTGMGGSTGTGGSTEAAGGSGNAASTEALSSDDVMPCATCTMEVPMETAPPSSGDEPVRIDVDVDDAVSPHLKGELEDLALKVENAVNNGVLTEEEGRGLIEALEDKANKTADVSMTDNEVAEVDGGRVWGDPHFEDGEGGKYDVQGEAGKTYNILSDEGLQVNAKFDQWGGEGSGKTTMGEVGITIGDDQVSFDKTGELMINGEEAGEGSHLDGAVTLEDGKLSVKTDEYSFDVEVQEHPKGDHLNIENIQSENANADGIMPGGLWGGTVDADTEARNGDRGAGTQGGGAIEDVDGNVTARGDKEAVKSYEVEDLFDTGFEDHNKFSSEPEVTTESVEGDIDRIYDQIDQLEAVSDKAGRLHDEIDMRVDRGQISEADGQKLHSAVDEVLGAAKSAVLSPDDENEVGDNTMTDEDVLTKAMAGFDRLDEKLNTAEMRPENEMVPATDTDDGSVTITITIDRQTNDAASGGDVPAKEMVGSSAVADQLKSLEWA